MLHLTNSSPGIINDHNPNVPSKKCILTDALNKYRRNDEFLDDLNASGTLHHNDIVTDDIIAEQHVDEVQNE